ncbi:hypothetical protein [Saccharomonospora sp. CUA-673]|uniref:hypothetical protein n=1 Tax=Saccharomonospora sp. CUA-673 TaxID=1904969 RepID=UPI001300CE71|nr:hypothetical protein [Saccharomonospora sp. CUA-673]
MPRPDAWSVNLASHEQKRERLKTYQNEYELTRSQVLLNAINALIRELDEREKAEAG